MRQINAYIHGCQMPTGVGGWAVVLGKGDTAPSFAGSEAAATSHRMDAVAVLHAVRHAPPGPLVVHTASKIVAIGMTNLNRWYLSGRLEPAHPDTVKNADIWAAIHQHLATGVGTGFVQAQVIRSRSDPTQNRARGLARRRASQHPTEPS